MLKIIKYTSIALLLAVFLHFFNGYVIQRIIPRNLVFLFIYDVFSLMLIIMLGIIFTHYGFIKSRDYKHIALIVLILAFVSMIIIYAIILFGINSVSLTGLKLHIYGIIFIIIPVIIGEYWVD
ncbi:MAG: hypothetical protein KAU20_07020 [Nanoarchaeota archaeon]|nr:hypothetical protein [Nanoarchaeota archaeon]